MKYVSLIQRFIPLQFGMTYSRDVLLSRFSESLEKINQDGSMVLNNFSFFHDYINDGIRSQPTRHKIIYFIVHPQLLAFIVYSLSQELSIVQLLIIFFWIAVQYVLCWIIIHADKQNQFVHELIDWSIKMSDDLDLMNYLALESGESSQESAPFNENRYAKLWLKEMSTSMDMSWENIVMELLPGESISVPKIRVALGGIRKSIQDASAYGFTAGNDNTLPNILLKMLLIFSRKKKIRFYGKDNERNKINMQVKQLVKHLELLFGTRDGLPIVFDREYQEWRTVINIVDRSNTERNNIKQSLGIFNKIMNAYTTNNRLI